MIPDRHQIAITGYEPDPPGPLIVRVGPNPPCPACNDYGVITTLDDETVEPCTECAPPPDPPKAQAIVARWSDTRRCHMGRVNSARRLTTARAMGCHSADGTYLTFGPDKNLPRLLSWLNAADETPMLWEASDV